MARVALELGLDLGLGLGHTLMSEFAETTLDGCCGAGGGTLGLVRAGHYVVGVDTNPALRDSYLRSGAHEFICADICDVLDDRLFLKRFTFGTFHPPCFPAGTPVVTARGVVPIETVSTGDLVLTHTGRWQPVTATMSRQAEVYADGWLAATADHPFWARKQERLQVHGEGQGKHGKRGPEQPCDLCGQPTASKYGVCQRSAACRHEMQTRTHQWRLSDPAWVPARDLHEHFIAIPESAESLPVPAIAGIHLSPALWWVIGRWAGDGWLRWSLVPGHLHHDVIICCSDAEADDLKSRLADTGLTWARSQQSTTTRFTLSHRGLAQWLKVNFGQSASGKTIPGWLLGTDAETRQVFLDGYVSADGHAFLSGNRITTVSAGLAFGTRLLATSLGYSGSVCLSQPPVKTVIQGRTVSQQPWWSVSITLDNRYTRSDGLHRWVKRRRAMVPRGRETVYDITVAEDHSFVAWGFVVHNCQGYSAMMNCQPPKVRARYPRLIRPIRERLALNWGDRPYAIENVESPLVRAELRDPVTLCMWMFGRWTYRHRLIEASGFTVAPPPVPAWAWNPPTTDHVRARIVRLNKACGWPHPVPTARAGHWEPGKFVSVAGHERKEQVRAAMEIDEDWMPDREAVAEAVPWYMMSWIEAQLAAERRAQGAAA